MGSYSKRVVDKIGFRIPKKFLNTDKENKKFYNGKGGEFIAECNMISKNHYYLMAHDVEIKDNESILDVVSNRFMNLYNCSKPLLRTEPSKLFLSRLCVIAEIEIAFDFYGEPPFEVRECDSWNKNGKTTYYTAKDYKVTYKPNGHRNKVYPSLIIIYDRGKKIKSDKNITRIEYRFKGKYMRSFLKPEDLYMNWGELYKTKIYPRMIKYSKELLSKNMLRFYKKKLMQNSSEFYGILFNSGWYTK